MVMNNNLSPQQNNLLALVARTLGQSAAGLVGADWTEILTLARQQAISGFVAQAALALGATNAGDWQTEYYKQLKNYTNILVAQGELHRLLEAGGIRYAVLKGCAAAAYYPADVMRTMGDIDFIVPEEQFEAAFDLMVDSGYVTAVRDAAAVAKLNPRHACYARHGVSYELHRIFVDGRVKDCEGFNNLIIECVAGAEAELARLGESCEFRKLPDLVNGLVILQHINQHLRGGVGLRQIIDWMMFVRSASVGAAEFLRVAERFGLARLAVNVTRMCQMYLGLGSAASEVDLGGASMDELDGWCTGADDETCRELMHKVLLDGNFGSNDYTRSSMKSVLQGSRNPVAYFKRLQLGGLCRWEAAQAHAVLRPLAWAYQLGRVVPILLGREDAIASIRKDIAVADQERELLERLGLE